MERGKRKANYEYEENPNSIVDENEVLDRKQKIRKNQKLDNEEGEEGEKQQYQNDHQNRKEEENEEEDNTTFEAGMILKVHMENFMCHSKFTITLGKMLNFITGSNGSGKSAVVAAIQLCLGASARRSGRASSVGGLIKDGHPGPAILRVDLLNEGMDAFEPEKYGRIIQVERKITKNGTGGYALISHKGEIISREKRELEKLLQHFNIFVDNPCCILTQEQSKSFINGAEKEKYDFFLKATSLERIREELSQSYEMLKEASEEQENALQKVAQKKEIVEKYQKDLEALIDLDAHEDEIQLCAAKLFWSDVAEAEAIVKELKIKNRKIEQDIEVVEQELVEAVNKKNNLGDATEFSKLLEGLHNEKEALQKEYDDVNVRLKATMKIENELKAAQKVFHQSLEENKNRILGVQKEINDIHTSAMKNAEEVEKKLLEQDQQYTHDISQLEQQKNELINESNNLRRSSETITNDIRRKYGQKENIERNIRDIENGINELSRGDMNRISLYGGQPLQQLLRTISQTQFFSKVYGPIGLNITMKDKYNKYGNAIEKLLYKTLFTFVVDNTDDRNKLVTLLRNANLYSKFHVIFQSPRPRYQITPLEDSSLLLVADTIIVEEDIIFNVLVDQARIDEVIVVDNERESDSKTIRIDGRISFPTGVHSAITLDGRQIVYRGGNKSSEMNKYPYKQLLAGDTREIMTNLNKELESCREEIMYIENEIHTLRNEEKRYSENRKDIEKNIYNIGQNINTIRHKKNSLLSKLSEIQAISNSDVQLSALEDELRELQEVNETSNEKLQEILSKLRKNNDDMKTIQSEKKDLDVRKKANLAQESEYEAIMENYINTSKNVAREIQKISDKLDKLNSILKESLNIINKQEIEVLEKIKYAEDQTPNYIDGWDGNHIPIAANESRASLTKRITKLRAMVDTAREKAGLQKYTRASLTELLKRATIDYEELYEKCRAIRKNIKTMKIVINERKDFFEKSVKHSGKLVAKQFDIYMQKKGFSGTVQFDHTNQLLLITTQTDNHDENTQCNDMRQMSGGERSYTTLCLLLALGHVIESPFRLMDEYDVFLDEISREITLKTIQQYALDKEQRGRQFIILTPHNVTGVVTTNEVRVKRMPTPHRRSALGPNQTTID